MSSHYPVPNRQKCASPPRRRVWSSAACSALLMLSVVTASAANLVVNGSFENNSASGNVFNPNNATFNALVPSVTAYGVREGIDLQTIGSGYGLAPQNGNWKVSPASDAGGFAEEFSMNLTGALTPGQSYQLDFYIERLQSDVFNGGTVQVGLSSSATVFGTQIASATAPGSGWLLSSTTFAAPNAGSFITVRVTTTQSSWVGLDNFFLTAVPEPSSCTLLGALGGVGLVRGLSRAHRQRKNS